MNIYSFFLLIQNHLKIVLLILFLTTLLSGYFIYSQFYGLDFSASLYYALSLFLGDVKKPVEIGIDPESLDNWDWIYIAGFVGFFTSALAFVMTFLREWVIKLSNHGVLKSKNYVLVIGFGENNRYYVDSALKDKESKILVLEIQENKPQISMYQDKGVYFEVADASKEDILKKYVNERCKHVIVSTGSDIVNFNIAIILKDLIKGKTKAFIHFSKRNIEIYMNQEKIFGNSIKYFEFYSYNEIAARDLFLKKNITEGVNTITCYSRVKILIVGFGDLGQEVALQALKLGSFYNKQKLSLTIIDKRDETKESFLSLHPQAQNIADFKFLKLNVKSESFQQEIIDNFNYTYVVVCLPDDNETIDLLFNLAHHLTQKDFIQDGGKYSKIPIAARFKQSNSIDLENQIGKQMFQFGKTSEISTKEKIIDEELDEKAKELNKIYMLLKLKRLKWSSEPKVLTFKNFQYRYNEFCRICSWWSKLDNFTKDSNRASAEHFELVKKDVLKHFAITNEGDFNREIELDQTFKYNLVDLEHRRWNNFHHLHNWQYKEAKEWNGSKTKEKYQNRKFHTCLVETDKLDQKFRENDLNVYRTLLKMEQKNELATKNTLLSS